LFEFEVDTEWDILSDSAKRHADLLGDADEHEATMHLWLQLAAAREADHPAMQPTFAARGRGPHRPQADPHLPAGCRAHRPHADPLRPRRDPEGFDAYLGQLRHRHRPKTKLLHLLDEAGFS